MNLKPVERKLVLKFLDEETDDERDKRTGTGRYAASNLQPTEPAPRKALYAQVKAAGPKAQAKKGQVVIVEQYARNGVDLGEDGVLVDDWCVLAVLTD